MIIYPLNSRLSARLMLVLIMLSFVGVCAAPSYGEIAYTQILPNNANSDQRYGTSLEIEGGQLLVGAASTLVPAGELLPLGAVDLYDLDTLSRVFRIRAPSQIDLRPGDNTFGRSVGFYNDQIIVGAGRPGLNYRGGIYMYDRSSGELLHSFTQLDGDTTDDFIGMYGLGASLSIDGDFALIGATGSRSRSRAQPAGAALLYDLANRVPVQRVNVPPAGESEDYFGFDVALRGQQGLIGGPGRDVRATVDGSSEYFQDAGTASLYDFSSSQITEFSRPPDELADFERLGTQVLWYGDRALVSGIGYTATNFVGQVYLSDGDPTGNYTAVDIDGINLSVGDRFGTAMAIDGDWLVVGAPATNNLAGAAYVIDLSTNELVATLQPDRLQPGDGFGAAVAINGTQIAISAPRDDSAFVDGGAVYLFNLVPPVLGDLNGDGALTNSDISAFVLALTDPAGYEAAFPDLDPNTLGDFTGNGALSNSDIAGFVGALTGGASLTAAQSALLATAVPEPTTLTLLSLGGLLTVRRRRTA